MHTSFNDFTYVAHSQQSSIEEKENAQQGKQETKAGQSDADLCHAKMESQYGWHHGSESILYKAAACTAAHNHFAKTNGRPTE